MFDLETWQEIGSSLWQHKFRTSLMSILVGWGIFMLVFLLGAGKGLENGVMQNFEGLANNSMFLWSWKTSMPYNGLPPGRRIELDIDDINLLKSKVEGVEYITPRLGFWGIIISRGKKNGSYNLQGVNQDFSHIQNFNIVEGRMINKKDIDEKRKVVVIGKLIADNLFEGENPIGQYVNIKGAYFNVVGVFKSVSMGEQAKDDEETIYSSYTALQQTFNMSNKAGTIILTMKEGYDADEIEESARKVLNIKHKIHPDDDMAVGSWNTQSEFKMFQGLFLGINGFVLFASLGTILAGVIAISVIMLITVKERTKEIGVRKALGATPWSVVSLVTQEALVITSISGFFGLIAGMLLIQTFADALVSMGIEIEYFANPEVDVSVAVTALIIFIFAGFIAGLIPAIIASKIKPIEALRTE
ncbi:MAG: ABC transporter permease [Chitinophagales bacterium]|nr:ABC transporter permease [Bacteroidota bacterium]